MIKRMLQATQEARIGNMYVLDGYPGARFKLSALSRDKGTAVLTELTLTGVGTVGVEISQLKPVQALIKGTAHLGRDDKGNIIRTYGDDRNLKSLSDGCSGSSGRKVGKCPKS